MNLRLDRHSRFVISAVNLLVIAVLSCAAQTAVVGMSSLASSKLREAMNQRDPERKLQLMLDAKPLFTDPESKYSTLYPNLLDAYLGVSDLNDAAKVVDEMNKAGVSELTEADSRLRLASAYINAKQYGPALQQLTPTIARLRSANSKPTAASKIQQDLVTALALEGGSLLETGSVQKALQALNESEDLRKTRHMDPSANTERDIARCYAALGKQGDAIENFGQAYSLAAHRLSAIQHHIDIAGPASSTEFTSELAALRDLISRIEEEIRPVYSSRGLQVPLQTFLKDKLTALDKALIADAMDKAKSNKPAPDFNLSSVAGTKTKLSELGGKVVLLNFWDITCRPCRAEYPHLQKIQDEFKSQGLSVLMISLDDDVAQVKPFADKYGFLSRVLLKDDNIQRTYDIGPIPHTVIIDGSGTIRFNEVGFTLDTPDAFRAEISTLLSETRTK
jgi:peroxiredoxin